MQNIDNETGEALAPRMPPEIAEAIIKVMKETKKLGFDENNAHGGYKYTSIDKFLEAFRPLCAEAGLMVMVDEPEVEMRAGDSGKAWLFPRYDVWLIHESGVMWGPLRRHLALPATGPQAFGAAESYVQKRLLRGLFMVPTGDKDAEDVAPRDDAPTGRAGAPQTQQTLRQHLSGGNGSRPTGPPATSLAEVRFKEIRAEIDAANTIAQLNVTGIFGFSQDSDKELLNAVKFKTVRGDETAWERLVERDASRRMMLVGPEGDIVA